MGGATMTDTAEELKYETATRTCTRCGVWRLRDIDECEEMVACPACDGRGYEIGRDGDTPVPDGCSYCRGTGQVLCVEEA